MGGGGWLESKLVPPLTPEDDVTLTSLLASKTPCWML